MPRINFMCGACHKRFSSSNAEEAARTHIEAKHGKTKSKVDLYKVFDTIQLNSDDESFATRTIEAQLSKEMGEPTDDEWLLVQTDEIKR